MAKKTTTTSGTGDLDAAMKAASNIVPPKDKLDAITKTASELLEHQLHIANLEKKLIEVQGEAKRLRESVLPSLMDEAGITTLGLENGETLTRSEEVYSSIAKANMEEAAAWFEKNGHGALLKFGFNIPLEKGDTKLEKKIRDVLVKARIGFDEAITVHPQTLKAFVKSQLEAGKPLPPVISVHTQPVVTLGSMKRKVKGN